MIEEVKELRVLEYRGEFYLAHFPSGGNHHAILVGKFAAEGLNEPEDLVNIAPDGKFQTPVWVQRVVKFENGAELRRRPQNSVYVTPDGITLRITHAEAEKLIDSSDGPSKYQEEFEERVIGKKDD